MCINILNRKETILNTLFKLLVAIMTLSNPIVYIFQVVGSLLEEAKPMRVRAALSRDGVEVYGDHVNMEPKDSRTILLQVIALKIYI